jgi:ribosomal protein S18 acetylase RimI-like enzyme
MRELRIVDLADLASFGSVPPCADPSFDHRTCDYWEDATSGSKAARPSWLPSDPGAAGAEPAATVLPAGDERAGASPARDEPAREARAPANPFLAEAASQRPSVNLFARGSLDDDTDNPFAPPRDNPFAPPPRRRPGTGTGGPRKLALLQRGTGLFGTYAKVLLLGNEPAGYAQFGPLSAYPRALALRDLYPQLPASPLPAVVTCIAITHEARGHGFARRLIEEVCVDLAGRGFAAVEAYPERSARPDRTSTGCVELWLACGFSLAVDDDRFPVVRREFA